MAIAIIVDWCGPHFSIDAAKQAARDMELEEVLYLALGKCGSQRRVNLQYVGVSNDGQTRFNKHHHRLPEIRPDHFKIWIGEVASHAVAGRRKSKRVQHSYTVVLAEWTLVYFLELPLNFRKRGRPPPESLILVTRWFHKGFALRRSHRGHSDWPDLVEYDRDEGGAMLVWFGSPGRERYSKNEVANLRRQHST